jgi:SAM-dependent methyltransferase
MPGYGEDLAAIHAAGFTAPAHAAARELCGRLERRSRVVELGCGDGTTARLLTEAGHDVLGIDASPALIELARRQAPRATFRVGSFVDADLGGGVDAILAVGEVLGYRLDARNDAAALDLVLARAAAALRPGGLLLFDLAGPGRVPLTGERVWREGPGWAVLVDTSVAADELRRRIVSFRDVGDGCFRRGSETHRLWLHPPERVLDRLRAAGFEAAALASGYAGAPPPAGLTVYLARRRG